MRSDRSVSEQRAEFNDVVLRSAKVGGQVSMSGAKVAGTLAMASADIGQSLFMHSVSEQRAEFNDVVLNSAKVGGQVDLTGAKVAGTLAMDSAQIGASLFMRSESQQRAEFAGDVRLIFAEIGRNLDVRGAVLSSLDLTGTEIGGELRLASPSWSPQWQDGGKLVLRNASVDAIQDTDEKGAWPPHLELDGFSYKSLGGWGSASSANTIARSTAWYLDWLRRDDSFSSQPYQHLAEVLRTAGAYSKANDILYASREQERIKAFRDGDWLRYFGLSVLSYTYGYGLGLRSFRILTWVAAFTILGAVILWTSGVEGVKQRGFGWCMWASFDWLMPVVELNPEHTDFITKQLKHRQLDWFYIQSLIGLTIAGFLTAGLTGFTTTMGFSGSEPRSKS
jgi:hypothetical protein